MAESGVYRSHVEKVEELKGWDLSPFTYMKLEKAARGFVFKTTVTKTNCVDCGIKWANKQCKAKLCKDCCVENNPTTKCATHGKKATTSTSSN
jgi:hypothetical protein